MEAANRIEPRRELWWLAGTVAVTHRNLLQEKLNMPTKLILVSKRGKRWRSPAKCAECGNQRDEVWRYAESNLSSPVFICTRCKPEVFDRSFEKVDVYRKGLLDRRGSYRVK